MFSVSIVILTRDRLPKIKLCLERLASQLSGGDEIVLVDTGSTDGTVEHFEKRADSRIKFFRWTGKGSWAEARNFGVIKAANPLIAFLDDDCYAEADWIGRGRRDLEKCDAVGGLVLPHGIDSWPEWWDPEMGWLVGISVPGHLGPEAGRYFYPYTSNLWAKASVLRAEKFQELGGAFGVETPRRGVSTEEDSSSGIAKGYQLGREDAEWWRRIRVRGYRTKFDPELKVAHHIGKERMDLSYLAERAKRDGEAWARREGTSLDLEPLAYQWWNHSVPSHSYQESGASVSPAEFAGRNLLLQGRDAHAAKSRHQFHRLMALCHKSALKALAKKIAPDDPQRRSPTFLYTRALLRSGLRMIRDRAKTTGRRMVLAFSPTKPWTPPTEIPSRIGVVAFGFVGDMVILQSCLRGLIRAYPELRIALLAPPIAEWIVRDIAQVELRMPKMDSLSINETRQTVFAPYLHGPWGTASVKEVHKLNKLELSLVSFDRDEGLSRQFDRERINLRVEKKMEEHEIRNIQRLFAAVGADHQPPFFNFEPQPPEIVPSADALERAKAWRENLPAEVRTLPILMLNPDAGKSFKEWTDEAWAETIQKLSARIPHLLSVNLSRPHPKLEESTRHALGDSPRVQWLRAEPLDFLIALLSLCRGIITVDAGPQHLAHALDVPSLTLYGPMDERRWGDFWNRPIHQTLRAGNFDLTPEELRGLPENHLMRLIKPDQVVESALQWLSVGKEL